MESMNSCQDKCECGKPPCDCQKNEYSHAHDAAFCHGHGSCEPHEGKECGECHGSGRLPKGCPDGIGGCAVYHFELCPCGADPLFIKVPTPPKERCECGRPKKFTASFSGDSDIHPITTDYADLLKDNRPEDIYVASCPCSPDKIKLVPCRLCKINHLTQESTPSRAEGWEEFIRKLDLSMVALSADDVREVLKAFIRQLLLRSRSSVLKACGCPKCLVELG